LVGNHRLSAHPAPRADQALVAQIRAARVALPGLSHVGYVRGAADRVPEALLAIGVPVELIGADSLARGDLSRYDAIVIGSRAYETEPALVANNGRLLDYGKNGGLVIVQYQQYPFVDGGFAPYPLTIGASPRPRNGRNAPVTELDPTHAVFIIPMPSVTATGGAGFRNGDSISRTRGTRPMCRCSRLTILPQSTGGVEGWPADRAAWPWDLCLHGLSFFRQLPAGVPGAYRLFMNLLGLKRRNVP